MKENTKLDFQRFIDRNKDKKNISGKNLIILKDEIKDHFSGWLVPKVMKETIDQYYDQIVFAFRESIIVLKDGSIISNCTTNSKLQGKIFPYEDVLKFSMKEKGFTSKGTILFNDVKIGNNIGLSPDKGYEMFKEFQRFLNLDDDYNSVIEELTSDKIIRTLIKGITGYYCFEFKTNSIILYELNRSFLDENQGQLYSIENIDGLFEKSEEETHNFKINNGNIYQLHISESETTESISSDFYVKNCTLIKDKDHEYLNIFYKTLYDDGSVNKKNTLWLHIDPSEILKVEKIIYLFNNFTIHNDLISLEKSYLKSREIEVNKRNSLIKELDVDGNGIIDISENKDFSELLRIKQKEIVELEKSEGNSYIHNFIKLSNYLKTKSDNIQSLFEIIKNDSKISNEDYEEYVGILKNNINSYNMMLITSLNMVISFCNDDRITFYEIYETFDKLDVFSSNHEREISMRLKNLESKLDEVVQTIYEMEMNICSELYQLQFISQDISDSISGLSEGLREINSSLQTNNLLTGIQNYQMYKLNKNTKSLKS